MRTKSTFPDWLFSFGDFWVESNEYPITKNQIVSVGFPYLENEIAKYSSVKKKKQVLFISQWTIGESFSKFASKLSEVDELGYRIVYKLHPLESMNWREKYPWLAKADLDVIDDNRTPLYRLFAESNFLVGVYSTAVYEGLAFGLQTFVFDAIGAEFMDSLVEINIVIKISSVDEIAKHIITGSRFEQLETEKFFRTDAKNRIVRLLSKMVMSRIKSQLG